MVKKILVVAMVVVVAVAVISVYYVKKIEKALDAIKVENVDFADVKDGTYEGSLDAIAVKAAVSVDVSGGRVTGIELRAHSHGPNHSAEAILPRIVEAQSLDVDAVTGSSISSKVIRKAVELAVRKGLGRKALLSAYLAQERGTDEETPADGEFAEEE